MTSAATNRRRSTARAVPFRGLRFANADSIGDRTFVPPKSWSEYADLDEASLDQHHLLHLLEPVLGTHGDLANAEPVAETLDQWIADGVVVYEDTPCMYVYRRADRDHVLLGVVAAVSLRENGQPTMLGHEQVIEALVGAQQHLEAATRAQLEPIVTLCAGTTAPGARTLSAAVAPVLAAEPTYRVEEALVVHEVWAVADPTVHRAVDAVARSGALLIADGHHRYGAWLAASNGRPDGGAAADDPWSYALTMLMDATDDGLQLGPVHRVVAGVELTAALESVPVDHDLLGSAEHARRYLADGPAGSCVLASKGRYLAVFPRAPDRPVGDTPPPPRCAVRSLHETWLGAWGADEQSVEYVHAGDRSVALADDRDGVAVLLPSPGLGTVLDAACLGVPLPRKSTSFGPKPRVGLVMRRWEAS